MKDQTEKPLVQNLRLQNCLATNPLMKELEKNTLIAVKVCQLENESSFEKRNVTSFSNFTDR